MPRRTDVACGCWLPLERNNIKNNSPFLSPLCEVCWLLCKCKMIRMFFTARTQEQSVVSKLKNRSTSTSSIFLSLSLERAVYEVLVL